MKRFVPLALAFAASTASSAVIAAPSSILFVGNSYTFGRLDPVMSYNTANVDDLTRPRPDLPDPNFTDTTGTRAWEPHPWGGVPGIFKRLADQAGFEFNVSMSARNAATLRGHFLNTANADWDLRGNIAKRKWDIVVLQEQSDAALPSGRGANANLPQFSAYVDKIEKYVHLGAAETFTERSMYQAIYGSDAACRLALGTPLACSNTTSRVIPANPNASADTKVYLTQTWARPDMVFPHLATIADANYPTVPDGRPIVDTLIVNGVPTRPDGYPDTLYYTDTGLAGMTADLRASFAAKLQPIPGRANVIANPSLAGVIPVGDAFQRALDEDVAKRDGFYNAEGTYTVAVPGDKTNLWWDDYLHASKHGSYLSALVLFQTLTGRNALSLGAGEMAAAELGIAPYVAVQLQRVAQATVGADLSAPTTVAAANPPANANGWNNADVTVTLTATDNANGSGVKQITFSTAGGQVGVGSVNGGSASLTINAEGQTTVTYYATDNAGNAETAKTLVVQLDKTPPSISGLPAAGCEIWPPNNKLVNVATVAAQDGLSGLSSFNTSVASSEAAAPGQPDTVTAGTGLAPRIISVRATRLGDGPGRTYTLSANATDRAGNATTAVATCVVPHDQGH